MIWLGIKLIGSLLRWTWDLFFSDQDLYWDKLDDWDDLDWDDPLVTK